MPPHRARRRVPTRRRLAVCLAVAAVAAGALVAPAVAGGFAVPRAPRFGPLIDPLGAYVPQTTCRDTPRPGVVDFEHLILATYRDTFSDGISARCGTDGPVSEHYEGRAWDWAVSARSPRGRAEAGALLHWLLATDSAGHRYAMARRLGIMYIIWDRHIWGSYRATEGWRPYRCSGVTLCHQDHVHFSFTWPGALARTTFYTRTGTIPAPPATGGGTGHRPVRRPGPTPPPRPSPKPPVPVQLPPVDAALPLALNVPADGTPVSPRLQLVAGHSYRITSEGVFGYDGTGVLGDTACSYTPNDRRWHFDGEFGGPPGLYQLQVDGRAVRWVPRGDNGYGCDTVTHVYTRSYTPRRDERLSLAVAAGGENAGDGTLRVTVTRGDAPDVPVGTLPATAAPAGAVATGGPALVSESVPVDVTGPAGSLTTGVLTAGVTYTLRATGTFGFGGGRADAACSRADADPVWRADRSLDWRHPDQPALHLLVSGTDVTAGTACNTDSHTYTFGYTPAVTGRARLAVTDPVYGDNTGGLTVSVTAPTPTFPTPPAPPALARTDGPAETGETLAVPATDPAGALSAGVLAAGTSYQLTVTGRWRYGPGVADAACSRADSDASWTWLPQRSTVPDSPDAATLRLYLDGTAPGWVPATGDTGGGCDARHTYTLRYTPTVTSRVTLVLWDFDYTDNAGALSIRIRPASDSCRYRRDGRSWGAADRGCRRWPDRPDRRS